MRRSVGLAYLLWLAFVVVLAVAIYFGLNPETGQPIGPLDIVWAASFIGFPTVGIVIVRRFPHRPLGWLLSLGPLLLMLGVLLGDLVRRGLDDPTLGWEWLSWIGNLMFPVGLGLMALTPLLLPEGRLPSPRWKPVVWMIVLASAGGAILDAFRPGFFEGRAPLRNPIGVEGWGPFIDVALPVSQALLVAGLILSTISLPVRFRRASGVERQQLKWLAMGAMVIVFCVGLAGTMGALGVTNAFFEVASSVATIMALPVSIALAIRRDRLYEVDVLLNRTLVYVVLSGLLVATYLGTVILLQTAFGSFTADSDLAVAGSTLAVAAMFRPLRTRVQRFIDRRFYRSRYDAAETLQTFSARLRDQVELDALRSDIVDVVQDTMQPAHASLWLRGATE